MGTFLKANDLPQWLCHYTTVDTLLDNILKNGKVVLQSCRVDKFWEERPDSENENKFDDKEEFRGVLESISEILHSIDIPQPKYDELYDQLQSLNGPIKNKNACGNPHPQIKTTYVLTDK